MTGYYSNNVSNVGIMVGCKPVIDWIAHACHLSDLLASKSFAT